MLVIWEPVLLTDWGAPSPALTSLIPDRRAVHFYDRDRRLAAMLGGRGNLPHLARASQIGFAMRQTIWDIALVYGPGSPWGAPAEAAFAPVVRYRDEWAAAARE